MLLQALIQDAVLKWKQKQNTSDSDSPDTEEAKGDDIALMSRQAADP